jgi:hypothetical protein
VQHSIVGQCPIIGSITAGFGCIFAVITLLHCTCMRNASSGASYPWHMLLLVLSLLSIRLRLQHVLSVLLLHYAQQAGRYSILQQACAPDWVCC